MNKSTRHEKILELVNAEKEVSVTSLADMFGVSIMTIRRDLDGLARAGGLRRTHGGAILSKAGVIEFGFLEKESRCVLEKQAIAHEVKQMIRPGMAVSLDTGTTTLEVARAIGATPDLTILTSSLAIASALYTNENIQLVLLGGNVRKNSPDLTGALTEENLKSFRVHLAVIGADAVTPDGVYTTDVGISRVWQAMANSADRSVVVADSSKFTRTAFVRCAALKEVDQIITDAGCPKHVRTWLEEAAQNVTYAPVSPKVAHDE